MKLLLFDIDGTLVLTGGAGKRAMNSAFEQLYGEKNILKDISLAGRTDTRILMDAFEKAGLEFSSFELERYKKLYFDIVKYEIKKPIGDKREMPGIKKLLPLLQERDNIFLGLLTGNWEKSGRIKIQYFGLNDYFSFGAFSDDSSNRSDLVPIAIHRFKDKFGYEPKHEQVYVIGDTPSDILCTKPHGVKSVACAAAFYSQEQLKKYEPDFIFSNFENISDVLTILG